MAAALLVPADLCAAVLHAVVSPSLMCGVAGAPGTESGPSHVTYPVRDVAPCLQSPALVLWVEEGVNDN